MNGAAAVSVTLKLKENGLPLSNEMCYELNCVPPDSYAEAPTPSTSECECSWRLGLKRDS